MIRLPRGPQLTGAFLPYTALLRARGGAIADGAEVYNPSPVRIGEWAVVSQGAYLCGASHDYESPEFPLISQPISIGPHAWIAARAIVHMRSEEHTSALPSLMRISYAAFCSRQQTSDPTYHHL